MGKQNLILVDCDGVLVDFTSAYLKTLNQFTGRKHTLEDVTDFDFTKCVANKLEDEHVWRKIDSTPGWVRKLQWMPGAPLALHELRKLGRVVCVTSPHTGPTWVPERFDFLMHSAGFAKKDIVLAADKSLVSCGDVLIDDRFENLTDWLPCALDLAILFDHPHNRKHTLLPDGCVRARGWTEVLDHVRRRLK